MSVPHINERAARNTDSDIACSAKVESALTFPVTISYVPAGLEFPSAVAGVVQLLAFL
jgi:hypothetical protein